MNYFGKPVCILFTAFGASLTYAQGGVEICNSVPVIFKETLIRTSEANKTAYKRMLCSATWESYEDMVQSGIDITLPIFDIPTPLKSNFSVARQKDWQQKNCDETERRSDFAATGYLLAKEVNRETAQKWLECVVTMAKSTVPRALSCSIVETETSAIFEVKRRMIEGMRDSEAPVVTSLDVLNTRCPNLSALQNGARIESGGAAILCEGNTDKAPIFVLNTDRGSCHANGVLAERATLLSGKIELKSSTIYRGDNLRLGADLLIVTNGHNLTIDAKRLVVDGAPKIVSFVEDQQTQDRRGTSAGEIRVKAERVDGGRLLIENFGQNGGRGSEGKKGDPGRRGDPGANRHWRDFEGCTGGHGGRQGGKGAPGFAGNPGAPGGNGGDVFIEVRAGLQDGLIERIKVATQRVDRDNAVLQCGGVCAGLAGIPGPGGEGGDGGPGGASAGADVPCKDGHPAGPPGPRGDRGPTGPVQTIKGAPGRVQIL